MATVESSTSTDTIREVTPPRGSTPADFSRERLRFTVRDYERMAEVGILTREDRVELIAGDILVMSPIGSRHASVVDRIAQRWILELHERAITRVQSPFRLDDRSEPQPDLLLLRPRPDFYASAHPGPTDVLLLVEVMDTSADYDRGVKLPLYARAGVSEVWLVDLNGELVDAYRHPEGDRYAEHREVIRGQGLAPEAFPEVVLSVDDLLG